MRSLFRWVARTGQKDREKIESRAPGRFWFVVHVVVLTVCAAVYFLIGAKVIPLSEAGIGIVQRDLAKRGGERDDMVLWRRISRQ